MVQRYGNYNLKMKKIYIFIGELCYFVYIIVKNVHLNTCVNLQSTNFFTFEFFF